MDLRGRCQRSQRAQRAPSRRCLLKADPSSQSRLLDLQAIDTRLDQIAHARRTLPALAEITAMEAELRGLETDVVNAQTSAGDVQRELTKSEHDVQLVRDRAARNRARLDSGQGSAKDLQALQHELQSLARRQSELEDLELEVMERAEALGQRVGELIARRDEVTAKLTALEQDRDAALAKLDDEAESVAAGRAEVVAGVGDDLVALYEKIRGSSGGVGAAEIRQGRCGGCRLELNNVDLSRLRTAAGHEVIRCEECRRIMVRTGESGL